MSRTAFALLSIAPEIVALTIIILWVLHERRAAKRFEAKLRNCWRNQLTPEAQRLVASVEAKINGKTYVIGKDSKNHSYIICGHCGMTSYNENDIRMKYCGNCCTFHEP